MDRIAGVDGVRAEIAMLQTPNGHGGLELTKFHTPTSQDHNRDAPANTRGMRHVAFAVEDIDVVADLHLRPTRAIRLALHTPILLAKVGGPAAVVGDDALAFRPSVATDQGTSQVEG